MSVDTGFRNEHAVWGYTFPNFIKANLQKKLECIQVQYIPSEFGQFDCLEESQGSSSYQDAQKMCRAGPHPRKWADSSVHRLVWPDQVESLVRSRQTACLLLYAVFLMSGVSETRVNMAEGILNHSTGWGQRNALTFVRESFRSTDTSQRFLGGWTTHLEYKQKPWWAKPETEHLEVLYINSGFHKPSDSQVK